MELDQTDKKIVAVLNDNSRLSYREIAKRVGVSVATALHRVKRLEESGAIRKYTLSVDYEKIGYEVGVVVHVRVSKGRLMDVEKKIAADPHVVALYDITGAFDALVIAHFKNRRTLDAFLKKIQTFDFVERTETVLILNEMKSENVRLG
ncbi:MAG TPA: Lrp/AsnC family transcriptional regulator [Candidatus Nanoarchaeia archaeon]|nr:Lrp/AsnC family transcriptional regulator [Candidatus Nanoarchaeia archaeon]